MASSYETVRNTVWDWIVGVRGWTESEAAYKAIPAQRGARKEERPDPPFLMIRVDVFGQTVGTDETKYVDDDGVKRRVRFGQRRGLVNIQAFGFEAADWLEELAMYIDEVPDPLSITSIGEILDISDIAGTTHEARFSRDFNIAYTVIDKPTLSEKGTVEAESVEGDLEHDPDPDEASPASRPVTVDLT